MKKNSNSEEMIQACGNDSCPVDGGCENCSHPVMIPKQKVEVEGKPDFEKMAVEYRNQVTGKTHCDIFDIAKILELMFNNEVVNANKLRDFYYEKGEELKADLEELKVIASSQGLINYDLAKELEDLRKRESEIWELWESMAECGQLTIGSKFSEKYNRLKKLIETQQK